VNRLIFIIPSALTGNSFFLYLIVIGVGHAGNKGVGERRVLWVFDIANAVKIDDIDADICLASWCFFREPF